MNPTQLIALALAAAGAISGSPSGPHGPCERRILPAVVANIANSLSTTVPVITDTASVTGVPMFNIASGDYTTYPPAGEWVGFDTMWNGLYNTITIHTTHGAAARLRISLVNFANQLGLDPRLLLGIVMAESRGNVGIGDPSDGQDTPGVMQCMGGPGAPGNFDADQATIDGMVSCGANHFAGDWAGQAGGPFEAQAYQALRSYNSGPLGVDRSNLENPGQYGIPQYVRIVADYLTGRKTD